MNPNPQLFSNEYYEYGIRDIPNAFNFTLIGSSEDYYENYHFNYCLTNWTRYLESPITNEEELAQWEEILLKDFLSGAREWLANNKNEVFWRCDLK